MNIPGIISVQNSEVVSYFRTLGIELSPNCTDPKVLVMAGGCDVNPSLYSKVQHHSTSAYDLRRDLREIGMVFEAKAMKIPILGICRGYQVAHVAFGGTLIQDIPGHRGGDHRLLDENLETTDYIVNSTHHQGVPMDEAQDTYSESYYATEGRSGLHFGELSLCRNRKFLGVQYHPERNNCPKAGRNLFEQKLKELMKG